MSHFLCLLPPADKPSSSWGGKEQGLRTTLLYSDRPCPTVQAFLVGQSPWWEAMGGLIFWLSIPDP